MARVKRAQIRKVRKKKLFKRAKGFFLGRKLYRQAKEHVLRAQAQEFVGRKLRKRHFRRLWTQRINAAISLLRLRTPASRVYDSMRNRIPSSVSSTFSATKPWDSSCSGRMKFRAIFTLSSIV